MELTEEKLAEIEGRNCIGPDGIEHACRILLTAEERDALVAAARELKRQREWNDRAVVSCMKRGCSTMERDRDEARAEVERLRCGHGWRGSVPENGKVIVDRCPSCQGKFLFIGKGGYLTCGNLTSCDEPGVGTMIEKLRNENAALRRVAEAARELRRAEVLDDDHHELVEARRAFDAALAEWRAMEGKS